MQIKQLDEHRVRIRRKRKGCSGRTSTIIDNESYRDELHGNLQEARADYFHKEVVIRIRART